VMYNDMHRYTMAGNAANAWYIETG
jgi:hypothetical protein